MICLLELVVNIAFDFQFTCHNVSFLLVDVGTQGEKAAIPR